MCNIFVKSILVCISALTVFIGAVLIVLPIHYGYKLNVDFETDETAVSDISTRIINIFQYNVIYISYLAFGIATIFTGFLGITAISKNNSFARCIYCMITLIMTVTAGCSIYIAKNYHDDFFKQINLATKGKTVADSVRKILIPKNYIHQMTEIQNSMHCCGFVTPNNVSESCFGWNDKKSHKSNSE